MHPTDPPLVPARNVVVRLWEAQQATEARLTRELARRLADKASVAAGFDLLTRVEEAALGAMSGHEREELDRLLQRLIQNLAPTEHP